MKKFVSRSKRKLTKPVPYRSTSEDLSQNCKADASNLKCSSSNYSYLTSFLEQEDEDEEEYVSGTPAVDLLASTSSQMDFVAPSLMCSGDGHRDAGSKGAKTSSGEEGGSDVDIVNGTPGNARLENRLDVESFKENIDGLFEKFPEDVQLSSLLKELIIRQGRMKCFVAECKLAKQFTYPMPFIKHLRTHQTFKRKSRSKRSLNGVYAEDEELPKSRLRTPRIEPQKDNAEFSGGSDLLKSEHQEDDAEFSGGADSGSDLDFEDEGDEEGGEPAKESVKTKGPKSQKPVSREAKLMEFFKNTTQKFRLNQKFDLARHPFFKKVLLEPLLDMEVIKIEPVDEDTVCSKYGLIPESCHRLDDQDPLQMFKGQPVLNGGHAVYTGGGIIHSRFLNLQSPHVLVSVCSLPHLIPSCDAGLLEIYQLSAKNSLPILTKLCNIPYGTVWATDIAPLLDCSSRLGLLLVASCEGGVLPVYRIPAPLLQLPDVLCTPRPIVELRTKISQGSSICVSWSPFKPNTDILAGFSTGMVCVWRLNVEEDFSSSNRPNQPPVILPVWSTVSGDCSIRSVEWVTPLKVIFVNIRGDVSVYNVLRDECLAYMYFQVSGVISVKFMPPPFSGVFHLNSISKKIGTVRCSDVSFNCFLDGLLGTDKSCSLGRHNCAVWAYSFDPSTGHMFTVDEEGSVQLSFRHWLAPSSKYQMFKNEIVMSTSVTHKCPMKSFNDCFSDLQCSIDVKRKPDKKVSKKSGDAEDALDLMPTAALFAIDQLTIENERKLCFGGQSGFLFFIVDVL